MRSLLAALALTLLGLAAPAVAEPVAVTFDDLPTLTWSTATDYPQVTPERLIAGLKRQRIPAIRFGSTGRRGSANIKTSHKFIVVRHYTCLLELHSPP